ncbi:tyrosine-protein phosphatase [Pareuzebyella sediminis]|uniref:tyrosine-protein phosphatase n=1 Tax=Pareuzebyella sediminis TaxID=2607998 RepID=UPI0011EF02AD|nr:CpsB/CapC family capsule biosynthesis tyrosine phosphatase [Pareuzebyella sediminis]
MFSFFRKKVFLIDHLEGFIDIHNHILPGIDDGAKTVADSIAMIKSFSEFGVEHFVATPHIMHNYYPNNAQSIYAALDNLKNALLAENLKHISIEASAEHMIDDNFETLLDSGKVMPMKNDYLLVEMSYLQPPINFEEAIIKTVSNNYYPILAHPERYSFLRSRLQKYREYKKNGIYFQMNLLSLGDYYGKEVHRLLNELLDEDLIDFLASDIHNMVQINALKKITVSKKNIERLFPIINNTIETFY